MSAVLMLVMLALSACTTHSSKPLSQDTLTIGANVPLGPQHATLTVMTGEPDEYGDAIGEPCQTPWLGDVFTPHQTVTIRLGDRIVGSGREVGTDGAISAQADGQTRCGYIFALTYNVSVFHDVCCSKTTVTVSGSHEHDLAPPPVFTHFTFQFGHNAVPVPAVTVEGFTELLSSGPSHPLAFWPTEFEHMSYVPHHLPSPAPLTHTETTTPTPTATAPATSPVSAPSSETTTPAPSPTALTGGSGGIPVHTRPRILASDRVTDCAHHAYGQVAAFLATHPCVAEHRFIATIDLSTTHRQVILSVATISFPSTATDRFGYFAAGDLAKLEQQPDTGSLNDLLREGDRVTGVASRIPAHEAFAVDSQDAGVAVFDAWYSTGPTRDQDPTLVALENSLFLTSNVSVFD